MKIIKGDNIDPDKKDLYKVLKKLPAAPGKFNLNDTQKYWYRFYGKELLATDKLTKVDLIHLVKLSVAVTMYQDAVGQMNLKGYSGGVVQTFTTGAQQIAPHVVAQKMALGNIAEVSKHFGFSFLDRNGLVKIPTAADPAQGDLFEGFTKQKITG